VNKMAAGADTGGPSDGAADVTSRERPWFNDQNLAEVLNLTTMAQPVDAGE
jgi:hypothetical protein